MTSGTVYEMPLLYTPSLHTDSCALLFYSPSNRFLTIRYKRKEEEVVTNELCPDYRKISKDMPLPVLHTGDRKYCGIK